MVPKDVIEAMLPYYMTKGGMDTIDNIVDGGVPVGEATSCPIITCELDKVKGAKGEDNPQNAEMKQRIMIGRVVKAQPAENPTQPELARHVIYRQERSHCR